MKTYTTDEGMVHCSNCGSFIREEHEPIVETCSTCWQIDNAEPFVIAYKCPRCGNEIGYETIVSEQIIDDPVLCTRCDNGEYTPMEPVYDNNNSNL